MKALVFAPHAGIWVHAFPEALVVDALRASNIDVLYVTCGGALSSYCVTMASRGLTIASSARDKQAVCRDCQRNRDLLRGGFTLGGYDFDTVLGDTENRRVEQLVAEARPETIASFAIDGIEVGRASLYEYLIQRKKSALELASSEWPEFRPRLVNTVRSLVAAQKILDQERPDRVLVYNTLYSVNAMWRAAATQRGIASYFLHAGVSLKDRLQKMIVARDSTLLWYMQLIELWPQFRDVPCTPEQLAAVTDHFVQLFRGASMFAYSAASRGVDIHARFSVGDRKLVVATMSSYDEYVAAAAVGEMPPMKDALFATQIEWVRALVEWFRARPDLFLIIRVHPREFPNKREGTKSEHAQELERELSSLPPNVRVNWPDDKLSIYDLAAHGDVFLNAWSSAGREMALLGLPVVVYCPDMLLYPADLNYVGTTREAYFTAIDSALRDGWSFERMRKAFRWCVLELVRSVVDISDAFDFSEEAPRSILDRAVRLALAAPTVRQRWDLRRRPRHLKAQRRLGELIRSGAATLVEAPNHVPTEATETTALRREVARLALALFGETRSTGPLQQHLMSL